ncbi:hypothetical protein D477_011586 [Arthrobacter crystallopoietes BAB-32]|uniref:Uncharacterized protein n=1 Tax=Arthrobacter crystallopoietes BAB-32 TaxID=1246476 RepID=N1V726_9MICC|nr:hypothetical protein [Arthrobacter crystallopoietes]EMY34058.1 hypothetical protein D477_011586 [Arthrobacter crystallopoietes BAB-32]
MGLFGYDSASERAASMQGSNAREQSRRARERDDINFQRRQEADYERRNWENKKMAFEAEQRRAAREGREPMYASPYEVPDIPTFFQEPEPVRESTGGGIPGWVWLIGAAYLLMMLLGAVMQAIVDTLGTAAVVVFNIISVLLNVGFTLVIAAVVVLTVVWLVKRAKAKGDPELLKAANMWNPLRIGKASWLVAKDLRRERAARRPTQPQEPTY